MNDLADRNIEFRSTTEAIDTSTVGGELVFHVFAAVAQMERLAETLQTCPRDGAPFLPSAG